MKLKGSHKVHLVHSDEFDTPGTITLCGREYDPANRTDARKTKKSDGAECRACLKVVQKWWDEMYKILIKSGQPEQRARKRANSVFEMD